VLDRKLIFCVNHIIYSIVYVVNSMETEVKSKRKRISKKTKKAWRKHSDIKDVENFLDDVRLQERTG